MKHLRLMTVATCLILIGCASGSNAGIDAGLEPPVEFATPEIRAAVDSASFTVRPEVSNRGVVAQALADEGKATEGLERGASVHTQVAFLVDVSGKVQRAVVLESSGHPAIDRAALNVAAVMEFTPARDGDRPVPAWISLPITFTRR
jgi:TonB family protein